MRPISTPLFVCAIAVIEARRFRSAPTSMLPASIYDAGLSPAPTTPPALVVRQNGVAAVALDPAAICGYFTLSDDGEVRTHKCEGTSVTCGVVQGFLACNKTPYTTCYNERESNECAPGKKPGDNTLCCRETSGYVPSCQTFMRDDGAWGWKRMLGCRSLDIKWDETVTLHRETSLLGSFGGNFPSLVTITSPIMSKPAEKSVSAEETSESSLASPTLAPTPTPTPTFTAVEIPVASSSDITTSTNRPDATGAIVGGVIGGLMILGASVCVVVWVLVSRRRRRGSAHDGPEPSELYGREIPPKQELEANEVRRREQQEQPPESPVYRELPPDELGSPTRPAELGG
ncbi:hypothetical protein CSOJ01_05279 [Colletotrichum sojae]|uniref:Uncharacterized protein n=1 Tax=Colletotrichum sojae TaxID=2175907 RepID=A0A8H6JFH8_9PEZI|nr:hypothetical protein CSOJ01_05279 [Colletotrichum sojae]